MPTRIDFIYMRALLNLFRNVMKYSKWWKIDGISFDCIVNSANFKQGAPKDQPTAVPVPHACAQPHHAGSSGHRHWGSEAWDSPCFRKPLTSCRGECKAVYQVPAPHNTCGSCWLGTARQFSHDMRGEGGSWFWCMCAPFFNLSFENSKLNCSTA